MINLLQLNVPFLPETFTPYRSGVWTVALYGSERYFYGVWGTFEDLPQIRPVAIGQVRFGLEYLDEVTSTDAVFNNAGTYYYDKDLYRIYVNIKENGLGWQVPFGKQIEIGIITGFCDRVDYKRTDGAYYRDIYYKPCIDSIPDFSQKRDKLFFGVNAYNAISVSMLNHDGHFDNLDYLGSVASLYQVEDGAEITDSALKQRGVVTEYNVDNSKATVKISDQRKNFDKDINLGVIDTLHYPYLDTEIASENYIEPIAIGSVKGVTPYCVNKLQTSAPAQYLICKAYGGYNLKQVDRVYYYNDSDVLTVIPVSTDGTTATGWIVDAASGILSIARGTAYVDGEWREIFVDFFGWYNKTIGEDYNLCGVDLVRIGYELFGGLAYKYWNYDLDNFAQERVRSLEIDRAVSIWIDSEYTVTEFIKDVCTALDITATSRGDGRIAVLVLDGETRSTGVEIASEDLCNRKDNLNRSTESILSIVKVKYGEDGKRDTEKTLTDSSKETYVKQKYHISKDSTFETKLVDESSAQSKATALLAEATETTKTSNFEVPYRIKYASLDPVDTVIAPTGRMGTKRAIYMITSTKKSANKNRISITAEKIIDITFDPGYVQGFAYGVSAYGVSPYGASAHEIQE